jgi:hypothetical protein
MTSTARGTDRIGSLKIKTFILTIGQSGFAGSNAAAQRRAAFAGCEQELAPRDSIASKMAGPSAFG